MPILYLSKSFSISPGPENILGIYASLGTGEFFIDLFIPPLLFLIALES